MDAPPLGVIGIPMAQTTAPLKTLMPTSTLETLVTLRYTHPFLHVLLQLYSHVLIVNSIVVFSFFNNAWLPNGNNLCFD